MATVVCTSCGANNEGGVRFCGQCGSPIGSTATGGVTGAPATSPAQGSPRPVSPPARGVTSASRPFSWAPVLILLAGMGALAAVLFLIRPGGQPSAGEVLGVATPAPAGMGTIPSRQATAAPTLAAPVSAAQAPPAVPAATVAAPPAVPSAVPVPVAVAAQQPLAEVKPTEPTFEAVYRGRKKCKFDVEPEDAEVYINGKHLGKADDWDGMGGGKEYEFESSRPFFATFKLKGFRTATVKIIPDEDVEEKTVSVDFKMKKDKDDGDQDDEKKDKKKDKDTNKDDKTDDDET